MTHNVDGLPYLCPMFGRWRIVIPSYYRFSNVLKNLGRIEVLASMAANRMLGAN